MAQNGSAATARRRPLDKETRERIVERLGELRGERPEASKGALRRELEKEFRVKLNASSFYATYWDRSTPVEPQAEEIEAPLQLLVVKDGIRVIFDRVLPEHEAYSVSSAITTALSARAAERAAAPAAEP